MTGFVFLTVAITLLAVIMLIWPLLRPPRSDAHQRREQNVHFARQRLSELEQQKAAQAITESDYQDLRLEIESTLANDLDLPTAEQDKAEQLRSSGNAVVVTLICCLVPVFAVALYWITGSPQAITDQTTTPTGNPTAATEISQMVANLEQRLSQQPNDIEGWTILARTHQQLGNYAKSVKAYKHLSTIDGNNADVFAGMADAAALQAGGELAGPPSTYVTKALELNPQHPQALWLAGLAEAQIGRSQSALNYWQTLLPLLSEFPEQQQELREVIQQTAEAANLATDSPAMGGEPTTNSPSAQEPSHYALTVEVALAEDMLKQVSPTDPVFVFARARQGPPAPLAVKRLRVDELPATVLLTERDAMMPQFSLALFEQVRVSARVAKSGNPVAQPGDIQSASIEVANDHKSPIRLLIDTRVE